MKYFLLILTSLCLSQAKAEWSIRPQAGLGFTDNANFENTGKDSDFFYWLRASSTYMGSNSRYHIWLNAKDYFKESQNDAFSYRFSRTTDEKSKVLRGYEWEIALGGMQYFQTSPGTTEESFSSIYAETSLVKYWNPRSDLELSLEPGYQLRYFPSFSGRTDHTALVSFMADWNFGMIHTLSPFSEFGMVFSNQSLYSKNYFEFGTDYTIQPYPDLKYMFRFLSKFSSFPNRQVSEATAVTNKQGRTRLIGQNEIETQSFVQIQGSLVKIIGSSELKGSLGLNSQSTASGYENYQEIEGWVSYTMPF